MADQLYLSLWYPNFRFAALPTALSAVLRQFAQVATGGHSTSVYNRVVAATAYPLDWTEAPTYQRIFQNAASSNRSDDPDAEASIIENAVREATEQLHEDSAYEFEMRWGLWLPEGSPSRANTEDEDLDIEMEDPDDPDAATQLDPTWRLEPTRVRITGFGPQFDHGTYETNGHIRVDFGLDTPYTLDDEIADEPLDRNAAIRIQQNVEKLLAFTLLVEKKCGISSRLLWTESGEPLAEKLIARLQRLN